MDPRYRVDDTSEILSPGLVLYRDLLEENLDHILRIAGTPDRLRPHCKTHKMSEVTRIELSKGIRKHKCATFAEAEMLGDCGVKDIVMAYNIVGPNIARAVAFRRKYPDVEFRVTADHPLPVSALGRAMSAAGLVIEVLLDLDCGQHRTGIAVGPQAKQLYNLIANVEGIRPGGFHAYDGHQHQQSLAERTSAVNQEFDKVLAFRDDLVACGLPVPRIVAGGTGSFPIYAEKVDPTIESSPGTCVLNDEGYSEAFPDLRFSPAALLLTRVVSRPTPDRVTLDLGYKAVASDPPAGRRLTLLDIPDAKQVLQNEEHLVIETSRAAEFQPGDEVFAVPRHVCPTSALHKQVFVISGGKLATRWDVTARDRWITI